VLEDAVSHPEGWPQLFGPDQTITTWRVDGADLSPEEHRQPKLLGSTREVQRIPGRMGRVLLGWTGERSGPEAAIAPLIELMHVWELAVGAEQLDRQVSWWDMQESREREALHEASRARGTIARIHGAVATLEEVVRDMVSQPDSPPDVRQRLSALVAPLYEVRSRLDEHPGPGARCHLQDVLKGLQGWLIPHAQQHQVQIATEFDPDIFLPVDGDRCALMLTTLLENAIRFSRPGSRVRLWVIQGDSHVRVMVSDSGIGIPNACQPHIGERGYQVAPSRGGAGMGLARLREVLQPGGGTIGFSSREGSGSTFHVTLPMHLARERHA
jgi:signal transduction histidine kinase